MNKTIIYLLVSCCFVLPQVISAQLLSPIKLSEALKKSDESKYENYETINRLHKHYTASGQKDSCVLYIRKMIRIAEALDVDSTKAQAYLAMAATFTSGDYVIDDDIYNIDTASLYLDRVLDMTETIEIKKMGHHRARALVYYGAVYSMNGLGEEKVFSYYREASDVARRYNYTWAFRLANIRVIENHLFRKRYDEIPGILDEVYSFLEKAEYKKERYIQGMNRYKAAYLFRPGSTIEEKLEATDLLKAYYNYTKSLNSPQALARIFIDIVSNCMDFIPKEELLVMAEENYNFGKEGLHGSIKGGLLKAYSKVLIRNGQHKKAIPHLEEAKGYLESNKRLPDYLATCDLLISAYDHTGQREKIISEFRDYKTFQDSFVATVYSDKLLDLEEKYESEKKENENVQLLAENNIIQTRFKFSSIIGLLLLAGLGASIYFFLRLRKNKEELEKINEGKNRLFAIVAHDLRGPVGAFTDLSESVSYLLATNQTDRLLELSEYYDNAGKRLSYTLTNLLDWAISQKDNFVQNPQPLDIKNEVDNIIAELDYSIAKKELTIENKIDAEKSMYFDKDAFKVIIRNLLHNSIKFSHKKSSVTIDFSNKGLQVIDYGIGMDIETKQKILSRQLVASKRGTNNETGSGIGLSTCIKLAEQNNARLLIESQVGINTTFTLTAPQSN